MSCDIFFAIWLSGPHRGSPKGPPHASGWTRQTPPKGCQVASSIPAQRRMLHWVSRPRRQPDPSPGVAEGSTSPPPMLRFQSLSTSVVGNQGLLGSRPTGRTVSHLAGKPKRRRWAKWHKVSDTRAPRRGSRLRGELRRCPPDGWRERHPRAPSPCALPAAAAAVATARLCQRAELPPRAATEKPRRVRWEGAPGRPPAPPPPRGGRSR